MSRLIALVVALAVTWLLWSGHYNPLLLVLGSLSVALVAWLSVRMGLVDPSTVPTQLGWGIVTYWIWLLKEIAFANYRVARTVLSKDMNIDPKIVTVTSRSKSIVGRVIFGNSITLTPGTVTIEMQGDQLTVHALQAPADGEFDEMNDRVAAMER